MKKMLTALTAVLTLAVLTGCCCDSKCPPCRTASGADCCEEEKKDNCQNGTKTASCCDEEKNDHSKNDGKTASCGDDHKDGREKDPSAENAKKLSAR